MNHSKATVVPGYRWYMAGAVVLLLFGLVHTAAVIHSQFAPPDEPNQVELVDKMKALKTQMGPFTFTSFGLVQILNTSYSILLLFAAAVDFAMAGPAIESGSLRRLTILNIVICGCMLAVIIHWQFPPPMVFAGAALLCFGVSYFLQGDNQILHSATTSTPQPAKPSGAPLRLLALLQREGRLLDFLLEDVQGYQDAQIGAAVRDIHRGCQKAIKEHLTLKPILTGQEGQEVTVPAGFDPSAVRLTGNVTGQPPFRGTLQHHGWRVSELKLTPPPASHDEFVVTPAEVHLQ